MNNEHKILFYAFSKRGPTYDLLLSVYREFEQNEVIIRPVGI